MTHPLQHMSDGAKHLWDVVSVATVIGTLAQWLPSIAALLTIAWTALRIFDWIEARIEKRKLPND